jgi:CRP-like cAMP-binding protein
MEIRQMIPSDPHISKLSYGAALSAEDCAELRSIAAVTRAVDGGIDLISVTEKPRNVHLVLDGLACRYKMLEDGRRSIMALLVPGDFCDMHVAILGSMDHSIATLTHCTVVEIGPDKIHDLIRNFPDIIRAMWWATLVDEATLREWIVNNSHRSARKRIAHLFCELYTRMKTVGGVIDGTFRLALTQAVLADILGLSLVHVNRMIQQLRHEGLLAVQGAQITIPDFPALGEMAGFDSTYLHLSRHWAHG